MVVSFKQHLLYWIDFRYGLGVVPVQKWGHVICISQSEARDGAEFQDGGPHLHI